MLLELVVSSNSSGLKIGKETLVGAGSFVRNDLPGKTVCLGNPAKPIKNVLKNEMISDYD